MCLIVDACMALDLLGRPSQAPRWLLGNSGNPRLAAAGLLRTELDKCSDDVRRRLRLLEQAGRLRQCDMAELERERRRLVEAGECASNDHHVIALARLTGARTLATADEALKKDFKNRKLIDDPRGYIYRDERRCRHLLRHTPSCGI